MNEQYFNNNYYNYPQFKAKDSKNNNKKYSSKSKQGFSMDTNNQMDPLNLNLINEKYNIYINKLREQLSLVKMERKKTENDFNIIRHRLTLLKNHEKKNNINFQNIKYRFKIILKNRLESQKRMKKNIKRKTIHKSIINNSSKYINPYKPIKKNKNNHKSNTSKNSINFSRSCNNFYSVSSPSHNFNQNMEKKYNNYMNNKKNNSVDYCDKENGKNKLREKLIEKLKEDEEEKRKIEEEIAKIEQEEFMLLNTFKNEKNKYN